MEKGSNGDVECEYKVTSFESGTAGAIRTPRRVASSLQGAAHQLEKENETSSVPSHKSRP